MIALIIMLWSFLLIDSILVFLEDVNVGKFTLNVSVWVLEVEVFGFEKLVCVELSVILVIAK